MEENTYKIVFRYIEQSLEPVSPHELSHVTGKSRVSIHTALKKLLTNGDIEKHGLSPKVFYTLKHTAEIVPVQLTIEQIEHLIEPILMEYPVKYAGILNSSGEKEIKTYTHMDIMLSFTKPVTIISMSRLEKALSEILGIKVAVITDQDANKYIKSSMLNALKVVYGSR